MKRMGSLVAKAAFIPPQPPTRVTSPDLVFLETKSNYSIPALYIKYPKSQNVQKEPFTLIFSHGNAEDLGAIQDWMYQLSKKLQVNVIAYDYVGYGLSRSANPSHSIPLAPSEKDCYECIDAVYNYALAQGVTKDRLVVMGRSLGTGPTTDLASRNQVRGVILQSPLLSAVRVVMKSWYTLPFDIFANMDKIHKVNCPVFILHGRQDNVVPFSHGQKLFSMIPNKFAYQPWWIDGASHNDIEYRFSAPYFKNIKDFLVALDHEPAPKHPVLINK